MAPIVIDESATDDPNQNADGTPLPQPRLAAAPAQLGPDATSRCARSTIEADYATPVHERPRAARSSRRVTR